MKIVYRLLIGLHIFVGVGAILGGFAAITNPQNPLGMSAIYLKNSPFIDYFIPGIILFTIIGLGNLLSALLFRLKSKYQGYISGAFGGALVIWIIVQCIMLNDAVFLHFLFLAIGVIQGLLSIILLLQQRPYPINLILKKKEFL